MEKAQEDTLSRRITVRLTVAEYDRIQAQFHRTTKRKLSEYVRALLLQRPVTIYTRSKSIDELIPILLQLKNQLSAIGNNFNQAVHRLHTLDRLEEAIAWTEKVQYYQQDFHQQQLDIKTRLDQIQERWLRE